MAFERLIYTNEAGKSIEMSIDADYFVNVRMGTSGLRGTDTKIYSEQIVNTDGEIETGFHVNARDISLSGFIRKTNQDEQNSFIDELSSVFSPFLSGVLRYEGTYIREIDVRPETAPKIKFRSGNPFPAFDIDLVALNPNWRSTVINSADIDYTGTDIYYNGTKACGMEITITAAADAIDMESLTITNGGTVETITFRNSGTALSTGDVLVVNTTPGSVSVTLNGVSALERIDFANTEFPKLYSGDNTIEWAADGDEASFAVSVEYVPLYLSM